MAVYTGINSQVPIYETNTITEILTSNNYDNFFTYATNAGGTISDSTGVGNLLITMTRPSSGTGSALHTITMLKSINNLVITIDYINNNTNNNFSFTVSSTSTSNRISGAIDSVNQVVNYNIGNVTEGDIITIFYQDSYVYDFPQYYLSCDPYEITTNTLLGYEDKEVARKVNSLYHSLETKIPIYETITKTFECNIEEYEAFFKVSYEGLEMDYVMSTVTHDYDGTYGEWTMYPYNGIRWDFNGNNNGNNFSVILAIQNPCLFTLSKFYSFLPMASYAPALMTTNILVNGENINTASRSEFMEAPCPGMYGVGESYEPISCQIGDTITFNFNIPALEISENPANPCIEIYFEPQEMTATIPVDYNTNYCASQITKGYVGISNIAKQFYKLVSFEYTGDYFETAVNINGANKILYGLTTSGTLTLKSTVETWLCGGGSGGGSSATTSSGIGGGGGYFNTGSLPKGKYIISIGISGDSGLSGNSSKLEIILLLPVELLMVMEALEEEEGINILPQGLEEEYQLFHLA